MAEKYRPSNGTEGDIFQARYCYHCVKDADFENGNGCLILARTMVFNVNDERYPVEWTYDAQGRPTCTAFEEQS